MAKNKALDAEIYAVYDDGDEKQFKKIFSAFLKRKVLLNCIAGNWMDRLNFNLVRPIIDRSDYVLFLVSEYSLASTINYAELSYAHAMDKPVYAIVVSDLGLDVDLDEYDFAKHFVVDSDFEEDDPALNNAIDSIIADVMGQAQEKTVAEENGEENGEPDEQNGEFEEVEFVTYDLDGDNTELEAKLDEYFKALDAALKEEADRLGEEKEQENEEEINDGGYKTPPLEYFTTRFKTSEIDADWKVKTIEVIENALKHCKIVAEYDCSFTGAQVTRFVFAVTGNLVHSRLYRLADEVDQGSQPMKGKTLISVLDENPTYIGVDVPNPHSNFVSIGEALRSREFKQNVKPLAVPIGKDVYGDFLMADIGAMPHLLVCGTSGCGKTELLNSIILSLVMKNSPDDLRFILVDPKLVELKAYDELPHVLGSRVLNEHDEVLAAFKWLRKEMELRYKALATHRINHISEYHEKRKEDPELAPIPYVVMIVNEFADLQIQSSGGKSTFADEVIQIAGKARAAGIHLIAATQRASNQVVTGHIKSSFPTVAAMKVSSSINSRIVIDAAGAEQLCCPGDMLLTSQLSKDVERLQAPFCSIEEQLACISFIKDKNTFSPSDRMDSDFTDTLSEEEKKREILERKEQEILERKEQEYRSRSGENDPLFKDVIRTFYKKGGASGAMIIRIFGIGYRRAVYMLDAAEELEFIKRAEDTGKIEVVVTPQSFMDYFGEDIDD